MRITSASNSLPMHIARAYGFKPTAQTASPVAPTATSQTSQLVAGTVNGPVSFDAGAAALQSSTGAFQMYTRAADRIEAAVAIQIGKSIDVTG